MAIFFEYFPSSEDFKNVDYSGPRFFWIIFLNVDKKVVWNPYRLNTTSNKRRLSVAK